MSTFDREVFAQRQAEMTDRWFAGVRTKADDVEAYVKARQTAYNARWNEALRFMPRGARILDIGGGNIYPDLLTKITDHGLITGTSISTMVRWTMQSDWERNSGFRTVSSGRVQR